MTGDSKNDHKGTQEQKHYQEHELKPVETHVSNQQKSETNKDQNLPKENMSTWLYDIYIYKNKYGYTSIVWLCSRGESSINPKTKAMDQAWHLADGFF